MILTNLKNHCFDSFYNQNSSFNNNRSIFSMQNHNLSKDIFKKSSNNNTDFQIEKNLVSFKANKNSSQKRKNDTKHDEFLYEYKVICVSINCDELPENFIEKIPKNLRNEMVKNSSDSFKNFGLDSDDISEEEREKHSNFQFELAWYIYRSYYMSHPTDVYLKLLSSRYCDSKTAMLIKQEIQKKQLKSGMPIEEYNKTVKYPNIDKITEIQKKSGINTTDDFVEFLDCISKNAFATFVDTYQMLELLDIYSKLEDKKDLANFSSLLLYLYNKEENKEDYNPNSKLEFIKNNLGIENLGEFFEKNSHLEDYFNGLKSSSDKNEAIEYLQSTYDDKIKLIDNIIEQLPQNDNQINAETLYKNNNDVIDILYKNNKEQSLEPLNAEKIKILNDLSKIENTANLDERFNSLKTPENKVDLINIIAETNSSVDEVNRFLNKNAAISDNSLIDCIVNKNDIIEKIKEFEGKNTQEAQETYENFSDLYNAIYNSEDYSNSDFITLSKIISQRNIKDSTEMLKFYRTIDINSKGGKKKKNLTSEQFRDFIKLMSFCDFTKLNNKSVPNLKDLNKSKEIFENIEQDITDFIDNDEQNFFTGKLPMELYLEYKSEINKNPKEITHFLQYLKNTNIHDKSEYKERLPYINKLKVHFNNQKSLNDFIYRSKIRLNLSEQDNKYIDQCCYILDIAKEDDYTFDYFANTDFLNKSKMFLPKFISKYDKEDLSDILFELADRRVPSLRELHKYRDNKGNYDNVLESLINSPTDIDFYEFDKRISTANNMLERYGLSYGKIDNTNILDIDMDLLKSWAYEKRPNILNHIFGAGENENLFTKLPNSLVKDAKKIDKYDISLDIAKQTIKDRVNGQTPSYENIINMFNLDEVYNENKYRYADNIRKILPEKFVDFVNDNSTAVLNNGQMPNISDHARLRIIERFAFQNGLNDYQIYSSDNKKFLNELIKTIYSETPKYIDEPNNASKTINAIYSLERYNSKNIVATFNKDGRMTTIYVDKR